MNTACHFYRAALGIDYGLITRRLLIQGGGGGCYKNVIRASTPRTYKRVSNYYTNIFLG